MFFCSYRDLLDGVEYSYSVTPVDEGIIGQPTSSDTYYLGKTICGDGIVQVRKHCNHIE